MPISKNAITASNPSAVLHFIEISPSSILRLQALPRADVYATQQGKSGMKSAARQFFTIDISVSVLRAPVFMFIHGLCKVMLTPLSLNIAPFALVWMTTMPGSLL